MKESMRQRLQTLARALTKRNDVKVLPGAGSTDFTRIYMSDRAEIVPGVECTRAEAWASTKATCAHESAHILFTCKKTWDNYLAWARKEHPLPRFAQHVLNCIEDGRAERAMAVRYPQTERLFVFSNSYIFEHRKDWGKGLWQFIGGLISLSVIGDVPECIDEPEILKLLAECRPHIEKGRKGVHTKDAALAAKQILLIAEPLVRKAMDDIAEELASKGTYDPEKSPKSDSDTRRRPPKRLEKRVKEIEDEEKREERERKEREERETEEKETEPEPTEEAEDETTKAGSETEPSVSNPEESEDEAVEPGDTGEDEDDEGEFKPDEDSSDEYFSDEDSLDSEDSLGDEDMELEEDSEAGSDEPDEGEDTDSGDFESDEENDPETGEDAPDEEDVLDSDDEGWGDADESESFDSGNPDESDEDDFDFMPDDGSTESENLGDGLTGAETSDSPSDSEPGDGSFDGEGSDSDDDADLLEDLADLVAEAADELDMMDRREREMERSKPEEVTPEMLCSDIDWNEIHKKIRFDVIRNTDAPSPKALISQMKPHAKRLAKEIKPFFLPRNTSPLRGQKRGRVDSRALYKTGMKEDNVFYKKAEPSQRLDVAAYLLVDGSGSMGSDGKISRAREATMLCHLTLKELQVVHAATLFDADSGLVRHEELITFSTSLSCDASRLMHIRAKYDNRDGYSIRVAAQELVVRPEKKKILFVISDGIPQHGYDGYSGHRGYMDTRRAVIEAERNGITVIGIHFGDEPSEIHKLMYPNLVYSKIATLPPVLGATVKRVLVK